MSFILLQRSQFCYKGCPDTKPTFPWAPSVSSKNIFLNSLSMEQFHISYFMTSRNLWGFFWAGGIWDTAVNHTAHNAIGAACIAHNLHCTATSPLGATNVLFEVSAVMLLFHTDLTWSSETLLSTTKSCTLFRCNRCNYTKREVPIKHTPTACGEELCLWSRDGGAAGTGLPLTAAWIHLKAWS